MSKRFVCTTGLLQKNTYKQTKTGLFAQPSTAEQAIPPSGSVPLGNMEEGNTNMFVIKEETIERKFNVVFLTID